MTDDMKVLGITFTDPEDSHHVLEAVVAGLRSSVIAPTRRLIEEMKAGARKSTALFLLRRYVLPVLTYHMGAWGLLARRDIWNDVDSVLDDFCAAMCPEDLRGRFAAASTLRQELGQPAGEGGLGIVQAREIAPLFAAELWKYEEAHDAGAPVELRRLGYVIQSQEFARSAFVPRTTAAHYTGVGRALAERSTRQEARRIQQNEMRGGTRAFDAVPWREELSIDNVEFDVAWRLAFGGLTPQMSQRIDQPEGGFVWRGERMEWAVAQAIHDCYPPGTVKIGEKPAPEILPPGCADFDMGDRADLDILTKTGKRFVIDVRTVNVQCKSGVKEHRNAEAHCAAIEQEKNDHYEKYFRTFRLFVVTLTGAVTQKSARALLGVAKEVGKGHRAALDWEPARWMNNALHRIAVEMVKTSAIVATRVVQPPARPRKFHASQGRVGQAPRSTGNGRAARYGTCGVMKCAAPCHKK